MSLSHALLGLLVERNASGYDLMKLFDTSLANVWPATQSQVYGELTHLAGAGLIEVVAHGPRGRKEYGLTENGLAELRHWLAETRPERLRRNETLLRIFFLNVLTREQALAYLDDEAEHAAANLAELHRIRDSLDWEEEGMLTDNGRLALEYGLRFSAMHEEWARWAAEQVRRRPTHTTREPVSDERREGETAASEAAG